METPVDPKPRRPLGYHVTRVGLFALLTGLTMLLILDSSTTVDNNRILSITLIALTMLICAVGSLGSSIGIVDSIIRLVSKENDGISMLIISLLGFTLNSLLLLYMTIMFLFLGL